MNRGTASLTDLATLLARAFLRLTDKARSSAVSCAIAERIPLEVSRPESPDHDVDRTTRRAS